MSKISINLLPIENAVLTEQTRRKKLIQTVSVTLLLIMFFLASLVVTLRLLQTRNLNQVNTLSQVGESRIGGLRERESTLVLLKDRLGLIAKLTEHPSKQKLIYDLVIGKIPSSVNISSVSLDSTGNLSLSAVAPDYNSLSALFSFLSSDANFKEIIGINVESLSRGRDGFYRVNLKLLARPTV